MWYTYNVRSQGKQKDKEGRDDEEAVNGLKKSKQTRSQGGKQNGKV